MSFQVLSTNERVIKLWGSKKHSNFKRTSHCKIVKDSLVFPEDKLVDESYVSSVKMEYKGCHAFDINQLCVSPDGDYFLSVDDLRVNLWSFENNVLPYNVLDLKFSDQISEVITHVDYHPVRSDIFLYSSSRGYFCLFDMRVSSQ